MKVASVLSVAVLLAAAGPTSAETVTCDGVDATIHIEADDALADDVALVCGAVGAASQFFRDHGFDVETPIAITLVDHDCDVRGVPAFGHFTQSRNEIVVMSQAAFKRSAAKRPPFGIPFTAQLYQSFVVHEVAHAIAANNFTIRRPSRIAHEYIAYVAQLALMEPALRDRILRKANVKGYTSFSEISETYLALSPPKFGVKVFLHFRNSIDQTATLTDALAGKLRPKRYPY